MKTKHFKLSIDNPCDEKWSEMQPSENGRYCGSCDKVVVDFSKMSDEEIVAYFTNYKGAKICGHIRKSQLERAFPKRPLPSPHSAWRTAFASFALIALLAQPSAQAASWSFSPTEMRHDSSSEAQGKEQKNKHSDNIPNIKGLVRFADNQTAIPNAQISVVLNKKVLKSVKTDAHGVFELELDNKIWKKGFVLIIAADGYASQTIDAINLNNNLNIIDLHLEQEIMIEGGLGYIEF